MSPDPTDSNKAIQPRKFCSLSKNWQKLVRKRVCVCWKIVNRDVWDLAIVLVRCGSNSNKLRAWMRWSGWFPILITSSSLKTSTFSIPFFKVWAIRNQCLGELLFPPKFFGKQGEIKTASVRSWPGLFFTDNYNSQDSRRREGAILFLYHFHPLTRNFVCKMTTRILIEWHVINRLLHDSI